MKAFSLIEKFWIWHCTPRTITACSGLTSERTEWIQMTSIRENIREIQLASFICSSCLLDCHSQWLTEFMLTLTLSLKSALCWISFQICRIPNLTCPGYIWISDFRAQTCPPSVEGCGNTSLVTNFAQKQVSIVKTRRLTRLNRRKTHFWVEKIFMVGFGKDCG